jgi:prepilin-type N-terminal cleavage/methylation domain-containing protein
MMTQPKISPISPSSSPALQRGFTIIELLIATLIFSMVLLLVTMGVLSFTKVYFKGLNLSKTQNAARIILENVAQSIQFSGGAVTAPIGTAGSNGSQGFCVADKRFSYIQGWQMVDIQPDVALNQSKHGLVVDEAGNCSGSQAQDVKGTVAQGSTELLSTGMRVSKLNVEKIGATDMYRITIRIVYGENDLLFSPSKNPLGALAPDAACLVGFSGGQYCATSELSTIVNKRINQTPAP